MSLYILWRNGQAGCTVFYRLEMLAQLQEGLRAVAQDRRTILWRHVVAAQCARVACNGGINITRGEG